MTYKRVQSALLFAFFCLSLAGCSAKGIYYQPNNVLYLDPHEAGLEYDLVSFPSLNGKKLYGIYFKAEPPRKGVVIHFHGNYGNVSNHFGQSVFLLRHGFDVLVFDYQGYGGSEGRPTPQNTVEDGQAAVRFVLRNSSGSPLGLLGQSLGASVAAVVAEREPEVLAVVLEAPFTSYRGIVKDVLRRSWMLYPFSYFVPAWVARKNFDPLDSVAKISPRPVLFIHGTEDLTVPFWMSERLFEKAREPKELLRAEGAGHLECRKILGAKYDEQISDFFEKAFLGGVKGNKKTQGDIPAQSLPLQK